MGCERRHVALQIRIVGRLVSPAADPAIQSRRHKPDDRYRDHNHQDANDDAHEGRARAWRLGYGLNDVCH